MATALRIVETLDERHPWSPLEYESPQAYARFLAYRDTPPGERSIRKLGISMQLAARWSKRYRWVARTSAYDAWICQLSETTANHAALRHRSLVVRFGSLALDKASKTVAKLSEAKLSADEAVLLATAGTKLARQALGMADAQTPAGRAPAVGVAVQFGSAPPWFISPGKQNETNQSEVVVPCGEQVLAETVPVPARTVRSKVVPKLSPRQPARLAEKIVSAPGKIAGDKRGGAVHSRSEGKAGGTGGKA